MHILKVVDGKTLVLIESHPEASSIVAGTRVTFGLLPRRLSSSLSRLIFLKDLSSWQLKGNP